MKSAFTELNPARPVIVDKTQETITEFRTGNDSLCERHCTAVCSENQQIALISPAGTYPPKHLPERKPKGTCDGRVDDPETQQKGGREHPDGESHAYYDESPEEKRYRLKDIRKLNLSSREASRVVETEHAKEKVVDQESKKKESKIRDLDSQR
jgi:hypothetical protein